MTIQFVPARRAASKARIALTGPSGSGRTWTGLALGCAIAEKEGGRLAVIDTERGKSEQYQGVNGFEFDVFKPQSFSPASLVDILGAASGHGAPVVLLDSWSPYWVGVDGMLEQVHHRSRGASNSSAWHEARPDERRMIDALMTAPYHTIVTLRAKTEYVVEQDTRGRNVTHKVGLKPEQKDGIEVEFDLIGDLDYTNTLTVSKSRIPDLSGVVIPQPTGDLALQITDWLGKGEAVDGPYEYRAMALAEDATHQGMVDLYNRVAAEGLCNAPVVDADGEPTVLAELIGRRGRALKPAA